MVMHRRVETNLRDVVVVGVPWSLEYFTDAMMHEHHVRLLDNLEWSMRSEERRDEQPGKGGRKLTYVARLAVIRNRVTTTVGSQEFIWRHNPMSGAPAR